MSKVIVVQGKDPFKIVKKGLEYFTKPSLPRIVLKPNLIIDKPSPTTTSFDIIEALAKYYLENGYKVIVAEGSGCCDTFEAYKKLGYLKLIEKYRIELIDLNKDKFELIKNQKALFLKEFEFPLKLKDSCIISVPVLKEHSITKVTLSLKNMLGVAIRGKGKFHKKLDESIVDINSYLKPSLAIIDGRVAGIGGELGAKPKELGIVIFSDDLVAADAVGASYLGKDPMEVSHLKLAQKVGLGIADLNKIKIIKLIA